MADSTDRLADATVAALLERAASAAKCAPCGCARSTVAAISAASSRLPASVHVAAARLRDALTEQRYDCLGCRECWPAEALSILGDAGLVETAAACPTDAVAARAGWPPLPGAYTVVRWSAPVAVCTLGDPDLAHAVASAPGEAIGIVGTLATENLGIERLVTNTLANPNLRFVVVAGEETRQAVGHLPGASLLALAANGTDSDGRIVGAPGRRPVLANLRGDTVERFRCVVEVVDAIGERDRDAVTAVAADCAARNPGPSEAMARTWPSPTPGYVPARTTPDPAGYFVIFPDRARQLLNVEHYTTDGVLDGVIEGPTPAHCYTAVIDAGMLTRLDHAAYLGRELAHAERALVKGGTYVQDGAPERSASCGSEDGTCRSAKA